MKRTYKDEEILRFLYDEMPAQESEKFLDALAKDEDLWHRYEYFQSVEDQLASLQLNPSDASVQKVLDFVKSDPESSRKKSGSFSGPKAGMAVAITALLMTCFSLGLFQRDKADIQPVARVERPQLVHEVVDTRISWEHDAIDEQLRSLKERTHDVKTDLLDDDFL